MKTIQRKKSLKRRVNSIKNTCLVLVMCFVGLQSVGFEKADRIPPEINTTKVWLPYRETLKVEDLDVTDDSGLETSVEINETDYDSETLGLYKVNVIAKDWMNNTTEQPIEVEVYDANEPVISLRDANEEGIAQVEAGEAFAFDRYLVAKDDVDGDVSAKITGDKIDTKVLGLQTVDVRAQDQAGNVAKETFTMEVIDTQAPVFTFTDGDEITVDYQTKFKLHDYVTMEDAADENALMNVEGDVDTSNVNHTDEVMLTGVDASGNTATAILKVTVKDLTAPTLTLTTNTVTVEKGGKLNLKDFIKQAKDSVDGNVKNRVTTKGSVDMSTEGTYEVTYSVKDAAGNKAKATLKVEVVDNVLAAKLKATALTKKGHAYVYGATGPNVFDCSGFALWVYSQHGLSLPRTAAAQFSATKRIDKANLRPGDLVFFRGTTRKGGITHVGIYIGDGLFIHASNPSSGVKIDNLNDSYYTRHFAGGGRK